jgi:hypothetical protein
MSCSPHTMACGNSDGCPADAAAVVVRSASASTPQYVEPGPASVPWNCTSWNRPGENRPDSRPNSSVERDMGCWSVRHSRILRGQIRVSRQNKTKREKVQD